MEFGDQIDPDLSGEPSGPEVVELRTQTSRTYETRIPGVFLTQQQSAPVNYRAADGGWDVIDPDFVAEGESGFESASTANPLSVPDIASQDDLASLTLSDGLGLSFGLKDAEPVPVEVDGSTATFADIQDGVDLQLASTATGVKETIILTASDAPRTFRFPIDATGLSPSMRPDGSVAFSDAAGEVRLSIPRGFMIDSRTADGVELPDWSEDVDYRLVDGGEALMVTLDDAWLDDPSRVWPVRVDPSLTVPSSTDDTYVSQGAEAVDSSGLAVLKAGYDGQRVHRSFLHFDVGSLTGMNVLAASMSVFQSGAGSCSPTPLDVYPVTAPWTGTNVRTFPGPSTAASRAAAASSGAGHDPSCPGASTAADLTALVRGWTDGSMVNNGVSLRARDETSAAQYKQLGSAESEVPPTISVLWSDPRIVGAPDDPTDLMPVDTTGTGTPEFSARYSDPDGDDGMVVFFGYDAATGAFLGATTTPTVSSGASAAVMSSPLPLDYQIEWRAMSVDVAHGTSSALSAPAVYTHSSIRITSPRTDQDLEGDVLVTTAIDSSVTGISSVSFLFDGQVVATDASAPYTFQGDSSQTTDGLHTLGARIDGGASDGRTAADVIIDVDNASGSPGGWLDVGPEPEGGGLIPEAQLQSQAEAGSSSLTALTCSGSSPNQIRSTWIDRLGQEVNLRCGKGTSDGTGASWWGLLGLQRTYQWQYAYYVRATVRCGAPGFTPPSPVIGACGYARAADGTAERYIYTATFALNGVNRRFKVKVDRRLAGAGDYRNLGVVNSSYQDSPASPPDYSGFIGMNTGTFYYGDTEPLPQEGPLAIFQRLSAIGVTRVRETFGWNVIERTQVANNSTSGYDWSGANRLMAAASLYGISVLAVPKGSPGWANPFGHDSSCGFPSSEHYGDYADFVGDLADRYEAGGTFWSSPYWSNFVADHPDVTPKPLRAIAIWNEPFYSEDWGLDCVSATVVPDATKYAQLAIPTMQRLDSTAPTVLRVVPIKQDRPGQLNGQIWACHLFQAGNAPLPSFPDHPERPNYPACTDSRFRVGSLWTTLRSLTDVWAIHPYQMDNGDPTTNIVWNDPEQYFSGGLEMYERLRLFGGVSNPRIWVTELGWSLPNDEAAQSEHLRDAIEHARIRWFSFAERVYVFSYKRPNSDEDPFAVADPYSLRRPDNHNRTAVSMLASFLD